jgi:hypothetical protein
MESACKISSFLECQESTSCDAGIVLKPNGWRGVRDGSRALIEKIGQGDEQEAILSQRRVTVLIWICSIRPSLEIEIEREGRKGGRA